jgi:DNA-binding LytR/AlgR family response regulator
MPLNIALCDDNPQQRDNTAALLDAYQARVGGEALALRIFGNGKELLAHGGAFDLYLLDILMPGLDGITLARTLRGRGIEAPVIFLTSSIDHALEAFNVSAFQYLLKPINREALFAALDKAAAPLHREDGFIMVQTREHMRRIPFAQIVYVEIAGRSLRFALTGGEELSSRTVRVPFADAVAALLADGRFLHAHKSYVLNMAQVRVTGRKYPFPGTSIPTQRTVILITFPPGG